MLFIFFWNVFTYMVDCFVVVWLVAVGRCIMPSVCWRQFSFIDFPMQQCHCAISSRYSNSRFLQPIVHLFIHSYTESVSCTQITCWSVTLCDWTFICRFSHSTLPLTQHFQVNAKVSHIFSYMYTFLYCLVNIDLCCCTIIAICVFGRL